MSDTNVAMEVRKRVLPSRDRFWRPEDFDASPDAVAKTLSRLAEAGELRRVRRGLYWRGTSTRLGMAPPPAALLACEVLGGGGGGTGPAGWSAALALGLSTQVPRRETIAVPGRAPRNPGPIHVVSRAAGTKRRDERLRPVEVALLEVLRNWDALVEAPDAVDRIGRLVDTGALRVDRLVRASATEPPRVRERLRHLLAALGRSTSAVAVRPARSESVRRDLALAG